MKAFGIRLDESLVKRTPGSKSEVDMTYQYAVIAFLAAKMSVDDNVEDYIIYSSESSPGEFDDVIIRVRLKNPNNYYLCLVQIKHKEGKKLNISDIHKGKSVQYVLTNYINSFNEIMSDSSVICRQGIANENIRFGIVTNASVQVPVFLHGQTTFELNLETHPEESHVNKTLLPFEGEFRKLSCEHIEAADYQNFFQACHLFLNPPNHKELIRKAIQIICEIDNANDIIVYVNDYFNDDFLHKQGLSKDQFETELLRIRLANSIIPLSEPAELINEELIHIWNKITSDQDITIVSNEKDQKIETCLLSCWGQNVISLLNLEINRNKLISNRSLDDSVIAKFKEYSKRQGRRYWLSMPNNLKSLLIELWKYGEFPLILKTNSKLDLFTKRMHLGRKYIILDNFSERTEEIDMIRFDVKLFSHIGDIDNFILQDNLLENLKVSLQEHKPNTLKTLLRDDFHLMKLFTCADIIGFMKRILPHVKEYYLNGTDYLAFLIEDDTIKDGVAILSGSLDEIGNNISISCNHKAIEDHIKTITSNQEYENYTVCCLRQNKQLELIQGDLSVLRNCFNDEHGNPVYYSDEYKFVPVIRLPLSISFHRSRDIAEFLIENGADINMVDSNGDTPLHLTVERCENDQNIEIIMFLIDNGADINIRDRNGRTPLHLAVGYYRNLETAEFLVEKGADINIADNGGCTALHHYVNHSRNTEFTKFLIKGGGNINIADNNGQTILHLYIRYYQDADMVKFLMKEGADINIADKNGETALHLGVSFQDTEITKLLIQNGADINIVDNSGRTPLSLFISYRQNQKVVEFLIGRSSGINVADGNGCPPLFPSVGNSQNLEIAKFLIDKGADTNIADSNGDTPLHWAINFRDIEIAKLLIEKGGDIDVAGHNSDTPLHRSVKFGDIEITKILVETGANINVIDNDGRTPLYLSVNSYKNLDIATFLKENGGYIDVDNDEGDPPVYLATISVQRSGKCCMFL